MCDNVWQREEGQNWSKIALRALWMATKPTESVVNKIRFWSFPLSLHLVVFFYILDFDNSNAFILGS